MRLASKNLSLKLLMTTLSVAILASVVVLEVPTSQAQIAGVKPVSPQVRAGRDQFEKTCMQCHATVEGQVSFGPNLHGVLKGPKPRRTPAYVHTLLKDGKGQMPAFGAKLEPKDVENLIAYLKTL